MSEVRHLRFDHGPCMDMDMRRVRDSMADFDALQPFISHRVLDR